MPTTINTNLASLFAQNSLSNAQNNLATSVQRLSSGLRINSAKDDAAGLSIAQNMQSQINGTNQSIRNLSDATNLLQVADSSLSTVQDMLLRLKQLSVQGFDGSLSASQKLNIVQEMKDLNSEINATAQRTQFNGINLLTSGASLDTVNSDVKNGTTLINAAAKVNTSSGLGAGSTLNDAGNTIYRIELDGSKAQYTPGTYTLQSTGNNLTLTGTFQGKVQSQTVAIADLVGYDASLAGNNNRPVPTNINFSNFGISLITTSSIAQGTTETGAQLAAAITAKSTSIVVDGKGGQISNVKLSGVNPGTYQMTFGNTGSVSAFGMPAGLASGQTSAGMARNVALVGGNGSGATANISYDAQGKISNIAVQNAGTGYKAGDVLSSAAITAGTVNAATITTAEGARSSTESAAVTFAALNAGQTVTLGGLTFTAGASGANATQVANAFANLQNGADTGLGTQLINGNGSYSGTFNGWSTGAVNGSSVQFTSTLGSQEVADLAAGPGSASVVINTTQGASEANQTQQVVFKGIKANESFTLGGLTFKAGSVDLTADQVAYAFTGLAGTETGIAGLNTNATRTLTANTTGAFTFINGQTAGATANGWSTSTSIRTSTNLDSDSLVFTKTTVGATVALTAGGVPTITTTDGAAGAVTEAATFTFGILTAGQSINIGGLMFTAGAANVTAANVASAFAGLQNGATTGTGTTYGTYSGALTGYATGASSGNLLNQVVFTSQNPGINETNLAAIAGTATTLDNDDTIVGSPSTTAVKTVTFIPDVGNPGIGLEAGRTATINGLTITAGTTSLTTTQLAAAFANLSDGTTAAQLNASGQGGGLGVFSGTFSGWSTGEVTPGGTSLVFTSSTPNIARADIALTVAALPGATYVQGMPGNTESAEVQFTALDPNQSLTMGGLTFKAGASGATAKGVAEAFSNLSAGDEPVAITAQDEIANVAFGVNTVSEVATAEFVKAEVLEAGSTIQLNGLTWRVGSADITGDELATAFQSLAAGTTAATANAVAAVAALTAANKGSFTLGTSVSASSVKADGGVGNINSVITFTAANKDVGALTAIVTGTGTLTAVATAEVTDGVSGSGILSAGKTIQLNGLTWTAGSAGTSASELATAFQSLAAGSTFTTANAVAAVAALTAANKGSFTLGTSVAASSAKNGANNVVTFTATNQSVENLAVVLSDSPGTIALTAATTQQGITGGTFTGTFTGWNTGAATANAVTFRSITSATDVNNLTATVTQNPTVSLLTTGVANALETARATFGDLSAGQITTLNGRTFTAGADGALGSDVATAFATNAVIPGTGALTGTNDAAAWTPAGAVTNGNQVIFTAASNGNKTDLASPVAGQAPVIVTTQQGGSVNSTETALVTFDAAEMTSGDSVTVGGLTFTAGANGATRAQVAAAFSNLPAGTSSANLSSANGTFTGTLTGWSTGASNGTGVSFTSATGSTNVDNLTSSVSRRQALNALSGIVVGGLANQTGGNLLTMSGLVNGNLQTESVTLKDSAANTSQTLNFSKFGIQFDVDSFQAQTGGEIGAVLASLNSSSANYGTTGAFVPGQVVVSQGANSALKFQSGADSSAFIQIDTLNIQTGSSGIEAGSDKPMMDIGSVITGSGVGKLGALGLNDSIDTWQTAFKNAAAVVDTAVEYISSKRATYGSQMNRLSYITTNLTAQSTNLQNSRSAIIDTDFASETAKLTKGQIMQQAATAMLAQANQMPNVILSLLK